MSEDKVQADDIAHPRVTTALFGHADAERTLLDSYRDRRMAHAWLIGGPRGIGKATLAYRMARFVLAHPDPSSAPVREATTLAVAPDRPAARRIAGEAHPDLLVLERTLNDKGKLRQDIAVDDVRRTVSFFGSTAGEGGWRVAIVDSVEELNSAGANALLKVIEEPPERALLLLVSHAPGRVIPTIRSRCRQLPLRPLAQDDVIRATATASGRETDDADVIAAAAAAEGSVGQAVGLLDGTTMELRQKVIDLLTQLPDPDPRGLHALGDALGTDSRSLALLVDEIDAWLSNRLHAKIAAGEDAVRVAQTWDRINETARTVDIYNLERKPLVFSMFGLLAETARG
jgi:DNA polymerase-3 subunit delta'